MIARAAAVVLTLLLLPAGLPAGGQRGSAGGQPDPESPTAETLECLRAYRAAIDDYRAKRADAAIATLNGLSDLQLRLIVRWLDTVRSPQPRPARQTDTLFAWDRQTLLAAGMLHVDAALRPDADFDFHALLAGDLLVLTEAPSHGDASSSPAERHNALAVGLLLLYGRSNWALGYLKDVNTRFPDDAPLLTAFGVATENQAAALMLSTMTDQTSFDRTRRSRNGYLRDAGVLYERAIALAPGLVEARVRLARVKTLQHDDGRAAELLNQVLAAQPAPQWRYMALLLLGGIRERSGRADEAVHLYEQAIDTRPDSQSAYLAMSHALHAAGNREAALSTLDRMFSRALGPSADEPWWDYMFDWIEAQPFFQDLRAEAQR